MGKNLLVCLLVEDYLRPLFVSKWTEFLKSLYQQKFTVDVSFGLDSLLTISDDYDYVLLLDTNTLFEIDHFMSLYYKSTDKEIIGGVLCERNNLASCIESVQNGTYMTLEKVKEYESPFVVDCASSSFLLIKKSAFEHLRKTETYKMIEVTLVDKENKETTGMLPVSTSMFLNLKEKGVRSWIDPSVEIKRIVQTVI
jgi:hypothetical protein